jgi:isoquinoline 1-oxidoreductase beta subunit
MKNTLNRRGFIQLTFSAGGALIAGFHFNSCNTAMAPPTQFEFSPLIKIDTDGWVTLTAKNPEIGQGVKTALPMILAEELGADWEKVKVVQAGFNPVYKEQWAGGSYAIILNWDLMRNAAARVRHVLLLAASKKMGKPYQELVADKNEIIHGKSGEKISFANVLEIASQLPLPDEAILKPPGHFSILGKPVPQVDLRKLVSGKIKYCIDVNLPGMVYATVLKNPVFEGGVGKWDGSATWAIGGVEDIIELDNKNYGGRLLAPNSPNFVNGIAVIADSTWAAFKGAEKLRVEWENDNSRREDSEALFQSFHSQLEKGIIQRLDGDMGAAQKRAASRVEAVYEVPFLAHVCMEPMNCTVDFREDRCEVWAPTQNPEALRDGLIKLFGLKPDQIIIHLPRVGGGFGRRYYVDYAIDAAILSRKKGKPVKLTWTREEGIRHDWYRPASVQKLVAYLDDKGMVSGWRHVLANASRKTSLGREGNPAGTEIDEYEFPAGFVPNLQLEYGQVLSDVPLGQWRGVGHSATTFAIQSFFDELAFLNNTDPIDYFLEFLGPARMVPVVDDYQFDCGRFIAVINKVRQMSNWDSPLPAGQGRGFAASKDSGSFVAEVVTVKLLDNGGLMILKVDAVVDCGIVINPSGARAQVEGGIVDGLCAALHGEITIKDGSAVQSNFHDYKWIRMGEIPEFNIEFVKNDQPPRGLGEPPLPPAAPALANAIFAAGGKRIRKLPLLGKDGKLTK